MRVEGGKHLVEQCGDRGGQGVILSAEGTQLPIRQNPARPRFHPKLTRHCNRLFIP
jgi:hypothetical protein